MELESQNHHDQGMVAQILIQRVELHTGSAGGEARDPRVPGALFNPDNPGARGNPGIYLHA